DAAPAFLGGRRARGYRHVVHRERGGRADRGRGRALPLPAPAAGPAASAHPRRAAAGTPTDRFLTPVGRLVPAARTCRSTPGVAAGGSGLDVVGHRTQQGGDLPGVPRVRVAATAVGPRQAI